MNLLYVEITENLIDEKRKQKTLKAFAENVKATFFKNELTKILSMANKISGVQMSLTFGLNDTPLVVETGPMANGKRRGLWSFSVYTDDESKLTNKTMATLKRALRAYFKGYNDSTKINFQTYSI